MKTIIKFLKSIGLVREIVLDGVYEWADKERLCRYFSFCNKRVKYELDC
jgi:hypothetical protein